MIVWWAFEVVPIPVTALIPILVYPFAGILSQSEVAKEYSRPIIFLFMGGFFLAKALEKTGLHKRLALSVLLSVGGTYYTTITAFMVTSFFISMWISNTATTLLMISVASGICSFLENLEELEESFPKFRTALFLSIAYSASIGGASTLIGTPPNGILASYLETESHLDLAMFDWLRSVFPFSVCLLILLWVWLVKVVFRIPNHRISLKEYLLREKKVLGAISRDEKIVIGVVLSAIFLWLLRPHLNEAFHLNLSDAGVALLAAFVLLSTPSGSGKGFLLDWKTAERIPWGVLLMFGGALSLAQGFKAVGFVDSLREVIQLLPSVSSPILLGLVCAVSLFLTEVLTNSAAMATLLPILSLLSERYDLSILYLALPATICSSFAFMLPVATPPNAIVFTSGKVRLKDMILCGFGFNLIALFAIFVFYGFVF